MKTIRMTVAQALVKFLDNQYIEFDGKEQKFVKGIMGIFGHGNVVGLGEALATYEGDFPYYQGKNEQSIAHVAIAYAKQKNRRQIYACTASIGPGSLNMVTAAGTATVNRIPVLFLPGDAYGDRQPDPVLQQVENNANHNITANDSFKAVSKYWDRIVRPEQLMTAAINAMRVLTDPAETGAVTLALPQDVQGESYDYPEEFFRKRVHHIDRRPISDKFLEIAGKALLDSDKPVVVCGGGVRYSEAGETLKSFATKFNIPIIETQAGKGVISGEFDLNLGGSGVCGTKAANVIARDSDLVVAVGTRLNDFVTSSKFAYQNPNMRILNINVNKADSFKMNSISIIADAKDAISKLEKYLEKRNYKTKYTNEIKNVKNEWNQILDDMSNIEIENGLSQTRVLRELNKMLNDDDIIVSASGSLPSDLERVWIPKKPNTYHLEYGFSCMGYEVAGALGAKMAEPDKEVYSFVGDGGYLMAHSELYTSVQEGKKINILLFDNSGHQCIHNLQRNQGIGSFATEFRYRENETNRLTGKYVPIDFAANARSYGAKAYTVTNLEELREAIKQSKKETVSTLIEIKVEPGTMTDGYESFWRVGTPTVSKKKEVNEACKTMKEMVSKSKPY